MKWSGFWSRGRESDCGGGNPVWNDIFTVKNPMDPTRSHGYQKITFTKGHFREEYKVEHIVLHTRNEVSMPNLNRFLNAFLCTTCTL